MLFVRMLRALLRQDPPAAGYEAAREPLSQTPAQLVVQTKYGPVVVPRHDNMIGPWMAADGAWEGDDIELLRWMLAACYGQEQTLEILDVGANVGGHSIAFARFDYPALTVHAFEAQRAIHDLLLESIALNGLTNVRCYQCAVSSVSDQMLRIEAVDYSQSANFGALEVEPARAPDFDGRRIAGVFETIRTLKLDDLTLTRVRLMKIDVEGMEHKVLAGAADTIARCRPVIHLEYAKTDFAAVKAFLRDARYRSFYAQRPNILCLPAEFDQISIEGATPVEY